jgi:release factor glutamine methyltransferase
VTVRAALTEGTGTLETGRPGSPFLDAALLLGFAMHVERDRLLALMPDEVPEPALGSYRAYLSRRASGEPVAYILGYKEFYGRRFRVDSRVLVPRPDTETLVEVALSMLPPPRMTGSPVIRCHDAFTGSGCVGITLAVERPDVEVSVSDASCDALDLCRHNALAVLGHELGASLGDTLSAAVGPFAMIVANPPYVTSSLTELLLADGGREPKAALDGGERGLDLYPRIVAQARQLLSEGGSLALEIGDEQGRDVAAMFRASGFSELAIHDDLAGRNRVVAGVKRAVR